MVESFLESIFSASGTSSFAWTSIGLWLSYAIVLAVYVTIIWFFYRSVARRDIFAHTLSFKHPGVVGFLEDFILALLRLVKYGIFFPIISFFWFAGFVLLLFFIAQNQPVSQIVLISIAVISGVRILAYYNQDTAQELAKAIPIAILATALAEPEFFNVKSLLERVEFLPELGASLLPFVIYLSLLELTLRIMIYTKWMILGKNSEETKPVKA
ncbi:MAG: hypothetical protein AABY11_03010 [archaeon]